MCHRRIGRVFMNLRKILARTKLSECFWSWEGLVASTQVSRLWKNDPLCPCNIYWALFEGVVHWTPWLAPMVNLNLVVHWPYLSWFMLVFFMHVPHIHIQYIQSTNPNCAYIVLKYRVWCSFTRTWLVDWLYGDRLMSTHVPRVMPLMLLYSHYV